MDTIIRTAPGPKSALEIVKEHVFFTPIEGSTWQSKPELPTAQEILAPQEESEVLPENPVDKPWSSKDEYLKAQYEILRCNAVEGLRYSVNSYISARRAGYEVIEEDNDTCIYTEVRVKLYQFTTLGPIARVSFLTAPSRYQIQWQQSKRLQPGKLVALSTKADGFNKICKIATIAQRPYRDGLDQDPPLVDLLWADPADAVLDPKLEMIMIESWNGYYEAARHALVGLQHAARTHSTLDKYLTGAHTTDTPPTFIRQNPIMNLSSLVHNRLEDSSAVTDALKTYDILNHGIPNLQNLTLLDESQLLAVHRMVSNELAVVQGPPGTGKTFTSVEAIKVMVENRRRDGGPPIIVAAQTNHALDQILAHCINSGVEVLRLGGRTKHELVETRTFYRLGQRSNSVPADRMCRNMNQRRSENVRQIQDLANRLFSEVLLDPQELLELGIISEAQFQSLCDETVETDPSLENFGPFAIWLADSLIPASILQDRHPTKSEVSEVQARKDLPEFEYEDEEPENIAEEEEDENRFQGPIVRLEHVWSGKNPANLRSWDRAVARALATDDLYTIDPDLRGAVYQHFQAKFLQAVTPRFTALLAENVYLCKQRKAYKFLTNVQLVQRLRIDVVGCTTTGLAKYRGCLAAIQPRILLIEEAAESCEANITSALYPTIQQLILVGDHKQLAPNCDIQWLGKAPYNLNVSLFQRMVNLGMPFLMLKQQRRMKPELRSILNPFYPELVDHPSVESIRQRPDIPGMGGRNCWFFDHNWPEDTNPNFSKFNEQEAGMITNFFGYLVANGTPAENITVLTFYNGQRKVLLSKLKRHPPILGSTFNVCTVDSYQGEENDVVLLSLVRSPKLDRSYAVGFLEDERRAVVAISRARRGLYVFGNVENVLFAHSVSFDLWSRIWRGFPEQNRTRRDRGLPLVCQPHGQEIWIQQVDDWGDNAGGCDRQCQQSRPCGHGCTLKCHPTAHEQLSCSQPCPEVLPCGHGCQKRCSVPCFCDCREFQEMARAAQGAVRERVPLEQKLLQMGGPESEMLLASMIHRDKSVSLSPNAVGAVRPVSHGEASVPGTDPNAQFGPIISHVQMAAQWCQYAENVRQADRQLAMEDERLDCSAQKPLSTAIMDVHQRTTLVDGRRVEDGGTTVRYAQVAAGLPATAPSSNHTGSITIPIPTLVAGVRTTSTGQLVRHSRERLSAISTSTGGGGYPEPSNNSPFQPGAGDNPRQGRGKGMEKLANRQGKGLNTRETERPVEDDNPEPAPVGWVEYNPSEGYDVPKRTLSRYSSTAQSQGAIAVKSAKAPMPPPQQTGGSKKALVLRIRTDNATDQGSRAVPQRNAASGVGSMAVVDAVDGLCASGDVLDGRNAPATPRRHTPPDLLSGSLLDDVPAGYAAAELNAPHAKSDDEEEEWLINL